MADLEVRMKRSEAKQLLLVLPAILSGKVPDPTGGQVEQLQLLVGQVALMHLKEAFVTKAAGGIDEAGESWAPLAPSTVQARRKGPGTGSPQILRDTGVLLNSLSPGGPGNILETEPGAVVVGTNVPYARYQHEGTETIPARPLWPAPAKWPARWRESIAEELKDGILRIARSLLRGG